MTTEAVPEIDRWADAALAATLFAIGGTRLGGMVVRAWPGPPRDAVVAWVRASLSSGAPLLRVPSHVAEEQLLGGLNLGRTLREGRLVVEKGILGRADGGVLVVATAERLDPGVTGHLCRALDSGVARLERNGVAASIPCRFGVLALDEGIDEERVPAALRERLAFELDLTGLSQRRHSNELAAFEPPAVEAIATARRAFGEVQISDAVVETLAAAAEALGVASVRGPLFAATAACAHAALCGRSEVIADDAVVAARLVLGPRATRMPVHREEAEDESAEDEHKQASPPEPPPPSDGSQAGASAPPSDGQPEGATLDDVVLAAAKSAIPKKLLDAVKLGRVLPAVATQGQAGVARPSTVGGRPAGTTSRRPRDGERLNVIETLRAAAPWQRLRKRAADAFRIEVRAEDFRTTRRVQRSETSIVFCVDASGSSALQRLAEAKGAVEQLLGDCYVRRDHVAMISFRGSSAALLLPPTRSLARARRCLAELAGGGTTPVATGLDAGLALALASRKRGRTPVLVVMTDGRANITRDGRAGAEAANADALASAQAVRAAGVAAILLDTAPRPRAQARALADALGARYLPLPYLDAPAISRQVQSVVRASP